MVEKIGDYQDISTGEPQLALQEVDLYSPSIEIWPQPMSGLDTVDTQQIPLQDISPNLHPTFPIKEEMWYGDPVTLISDKSLTVEMEDISPYLMPDEHMSKIVRIETPKPPRQLSTDEVMMKLGRVQSIDEIGKYTLMAAMPAEGSEHIDELNRYIADFGRDPLVAMLMAGDIYPKAAEKQSVFLAEHQGKTTNIAREEEKGKAPHEIRPPDDPVAIALAKLGWELPYYGTIDATALHIKLIMDVVRRNPAFLDTRIDQGERSMEDALLAAKDYLVRKQDEQLMKYQAGNMNGEVSEKPSRLIEHKRLNPKGIENQNWKDSKDSLSHSDGTLPDPDSPKTYLEVQVYTYDAFLDMAEYYAEKDPQLASDLSERAGVLKDQILEKFWIEDDQGGYFVPALERVTGDNGDEILKPFEIRTSNMGHTLWSRLLKGDDKNIVEIREKLLRTLHSPDMRNISGFRTLSSNEVRFKPTAYHNGNVWPWDSMWVALGEEALGYKALARQDMFDIYQGIKASGIMPEYEKGGFSLKPQLNEREVTTKTNGKFNLIEQVPQQYQLWTTATARRIEEEMKNWTSDAVVTPFEAEILEMMKNGMIAASAEYGIAAD